MYQKRATCLYEKSGQGGPLEGPGHEQKEPNHPNEEDGMYSSLKQAPFFDAQTRWVEGFFALVCASKKWHCWDGAWIFLIFLVVT